MSVVLVMPVARMQIGDVLGKAVSRDLIAAQRPSRRHRPAQSAAARALTYVETNGFFQLSGLESLRDLPDFDWLEGDRRQRRSGWYVAAFKE